LQSNKAKDAFKIFDYIHTLDNEKLAQIFSKLEGNLLKKIKYFIQVNIGNEPQKSGIPIEKVSKFIEYCINDLNLNIIGLMCIPPADCEPDKYFISLSEIASQHNLEHLFFDLLKKIQKKVFTMGEVHGFAITNSIRFEGTELGVHNIYDASLAVNFVYRFYNRLSLKFLMYGLINSIKIVLRSKLHKKVKLPQIK
jgi:hypothetical protein